MRTRNIFITAEEFPKPLIAMINGFCLGGGNELAMCCDLRIASEKARFGQPEINLGIIPGGGGTQRLTRLIGEGRSMQLILTGEMIDAAEAWRLGLVNEIHPADQLRARTLDLAERIAARSPIALAMARRQSRARGSQTCARGSILRSTSSLCFSSEDKTREFAPSLRSEDQILRDDNRQNLKQESRNQ
jgi:enoyl-CoA hydratase